MRAMSRNTCPILKDYHVGDLLMFRKEQGMDWFGPARVLGKEDKVLWCLHQGVPVAAAMNRARPATLQRTLRTCAWARGLMPIRPTAAGSQQGFIDVTSRRRQREGSDDDDEEPPPSRRVRLQTEPENI